MSPSDPPASDLGARTPLTPEERRQYCAHIVALDRPGLLRLVGRYEATVYAQAAQLAAAEVERAFFAWRVGDLEALLLRLGVRPEARAAVVQRWRMLQVVPAGAVETGDGE